MLPRNFGAILLAAVCVALAFGDLFHPLSQKFVGLIPLATAPWVADGSVVKFHLHPTFENPAVEGLAAGQKAMLDRLAWGAFTIGAEVQGVRLELDLATEVPGAPPLFRSR